MILAFSVVRVPGTPAPWHPGTRFPLLPRSAVYCYFLCSAVAPAPVLGGRPTVGQQTLTLLIGVRIPASQPQVVDSKGSVAQRILPLPQCRLAPTNLARKNLQRFGEIRQCLHKRQMPFPTESPPNHGPVPLLVPRAIGFTGNRNSGRA